MSRESFRDRDKEKNTKKYDVTLNVKEVHLHIHNHAQDAELAEAKKRIEVLETENALVVKRIEEMGGKVAGDTSSMKDAVDSAKEGT